MCFTLQKNVLYIYCGPVDSCGPTAWRYLYTADVLRARTVAYIACGPTVRIACFCCGSGAGPLIFAGPLFIYTVSLRICCGSAAGPFILAGPLFIYTVSLRICCGSAAGPLILAGPLFIYTVSLRICCGSAAGPLILAGPLFIYTVSLRICCGSVRRAIADLLRSCKSTLKIIINSFSRCGC